MTENTKTNYLSNRELLKEIHKSKMSYCWLEDQKYYMYDIILEDVSKINKRTISEAKKNRASRLQSEAYEAAIKEYEKAVQEYEKATGGKKTKSSEISAPVKPKQKEFAVDPKSIPDEDITVRVMTYEHIPLETNTRRKPRKLSEHYVKLNFIPFKHYALRDGEPVEVARSHSKDGEFCQDQGALTDQLARMCMLLVHRYSQRANWRGYSYVDEMVGQSLLQLSAMALKFDESKSSNPFSYYTQSIQNTFTRVLNSEKKVQLARDEILISRGQTPSFGRQIQHEEEQRALRSESDSD